MREPMKLEELCPYTFKAIRNRIDKDIKKQVDFTLPSMPMVEACRANDFDFFHPLIESGDLTVDQMHHAAARYHLGKSKSGRPIFWMIDEMQEVLDGHIGNTWVSQTLKSREPMLQYWQVKHCLFGLHLISQCASMPVNIVESEASAVVLCELLPEFLWMAYCDNSNLTVDLLEPLQGYSVTIYPRTDPSMSNYLFFLEYANTVRQTYPSIHLTIDDTLEENASSEQKSRCIDLLDFILDK